MKIKYRSFHRFLLNFASVFRRTNLLRSMIIEYYNYLVEESKSDDDSDNDSHGGGSKEEKSQEPCGEGISKTKVQ